MSKIRGKDTKPEVAVRSFLHRQGLRFRLHRRDLPGAPDIVLPRHNAVVFVHGCFWHQHADCRDGRVPDSRKHYWVPKLEKTKKRDKKHISALKAAGWHVHVVWECEVGEERLVRLVRDIRGSAEKGK